MNTARRLLLIGAFGALAAAGAGEAATLYTPVRTVVAQCDGYLIPFDPYHQTCGIPNQIPTVPGASPGAGTIIACRNIPGCLSAAVNGPQLVPIPRRDSNVRQSR